MRAHGEGGSDEEAGRLHRDYTTREEARRTETGGLITACSLVYGWLPTVNESAATRTPARPLQFSPRNAKADTNVDDDNDAPCKLVANGKDEPNEPFPTDRSPNGAGAAAHPIDFERSN